MADDTALRLYRALVRHDPAAAISVIERAAATGMPQAVLFDSVFAPAMAILGGSWADGSINEYTFAQAAAVADQVIPFVAPPLTPPDTGVGVVIGSMHGDMHDVRKNVIASALRDAGHRVFDLGVDVRPTLFLERVEETGARIAIVCAETVETAHAVTRVKEMFVSSDRHDVALLVSGGPFVADPRLVTAAGARAHVTGVTEALAVVAAASGRDQRGDS